MNWLGPSLVIGGIPCSLGYSLQAMRRLPERQLAIAALVLASLELIAVASLILRESLYG